jgi:hypothetical protein
MDKAPLSTFIRLGSKLSKQGYGELQDKQNNTCALGAAVHAKTGELPHDNYKEVGMLFPQLMSQVKHPITSRSQELRFLSNVITDLNDNWKWSREQIADWLESIGL